MKRTESQKAAVRAIRTAATALIKEVDRWHDPRFTEFHADFHLERWRISKPEIEGTNWALDSQGRKCPIKIGQPIYKASNVRIAQ